MKLQRNEPSGIHLITGHGDAYIEVGQRRLAHSLILLPNQLHDWPVPTFEALTAEHFSAIAAHRPELVLLGTGARLRFPAPALYAALVAQGIGLEVMDVGAACRTYNFLAGEGRRVAAALILEGG